MDKHCNFITKRFFSALRTFFHKQKAAFQSSRGRINLKRFSRVELIRKAESAGGAEKLFWLKCLAIKANSSGGHVGGFAASRNPPALGRHSELFPWCGRATFVVASGKQLRRMCWLYCVSELLNIRRWCTENEIRNNAFLDSTTLSAVGQLI